MTWLDKFKADHPTLDDDYIMDMYCPDDKLVSMICEESDGLPECRKCWLRQVPEPVEATIGRPGETTEGPDRT